jgi:hypothetical protein
MAGRPDFAGEYLLNVPSSALEGGAASVRSAVLRIEHRGPMLHFHGDFAFDDASTSFDYALEPVDAQGASLRWSATRCCSVTQTPR